MKLREATGVLYDRRIPIKLKNKFYKIIVWSVMLHRLNCCSKQENRTDEECSREYAKMDKLGYQL